MNLITTPAQVGYTPAATAIVHNAQVSLTSRPPASIVHLVQYDVTIPIVAVALMANGQPYTVPSGAAVNVRLAKPGGTYVYNPALGVSEDGQTAIIAMERAVPAWSHEQDYSTWPVGAPVADEGQVRLLIQPHNAANYEGRPSTLRALWGLAHTKDPTRAKPWVDPYGTSGMYMTGECYRTDDGTVYRCLQDNCVYDAQALPSA